MEYTHLVNECKLTVNSLFQHAGVSMHVLNTEFFGYIMKDKKYKDTNEASRDFFRFKLDTLGELYIQG